MEPDPQHQSATPRDVDAQRAAERAQDAVLVQRTLAGDRDAFEEIYQRHRRKVFKIAYGMTRSEEDALDVVQDTFVKARRSLDRFEGRAGLGTWLCQIATHQAIDLARRRKVRQTEPLDEALTGSERLGESPRGRAQERELKAALERALGQLSEKHRTVFVLYTVKGLAYKEIAQVLGISLGTVMSRLFYARKNLQRMLEEYADA